MPLADLFGRTQAMELAGPRSFARGLAYHRDGRVESEAERDGRLRARVRGSVPYVVELWDDEGECGWSCTCPAAEDGSFCKHCVAVALQLDGAGSLPSHLVPTPVPGDDESCETDLGSYLSGLGRERLEELVLEATESDWRLRERLHAEARAARGIGPELETWRRRLDAVFAPYDEFVSWREAEGWAADVSEMIDALEDLCDAGHADAVALLAEHAHRRADEAIQYVDDSDGCLGVISERLGELHRRACREGSPDPVQLAGRLVDLELTSELDGFHRAAASHADVLGTEGLAEYRRLLEPRWRKVAKSTGSRSVDRFRVREAMIGVALASGDPDELIAVRRHDLRSPDAFLEVAREFRRAGRTEEAVEWSQRGLAEFGDGTWQTPPLREFLASILRGRGDHADAIELFWDAFERAPALDAYRRLLTEADGDPERWKARALDSLRARVAERRPEDRERRSLLAATPAHALAEILAFEGDTDAAWESATEFGCGDRLWLTLARAREESHPLDAIGVYEREALSQIHRKKNDAYRAAVDLLERIRRLASAAHEPERFEQLLVRVRTEHKAKRNLKALIDAKGW